VLGVREPPYYGPRRSASKTIPANSFLSHGEEIDLAPRLLPSVGEGGNHAWGRIAKAKGKGTAAWTGDPGEAEDEPRIRRLFQAEAWASPVCGGDVPTAER